MNFTLAINYALGGVKPWGYHALNLTIHILAGLTLFGIVRRTLRQPILSERFGAEATPLALAIALLWTVHPLPTEAVTYTVQRAESLMGLFYLLTLYCFIRGVESRNPVGWYALSMTACLLGMGSKEVMVSAPLMVLLYDWLFVTGDLKEIWTRRWRLYAGLAGTWVLLGYLVVNTGDRGGSAGFASEVAWWPYALTQCWAVVHYLKLSAWPSPLVFDYGSPTIRQLGQALPYALVLAVLAIGTLMALRRRRAVGFLGFWFFAILAPSSSVVPVGTQTMAEHRMYLPLVAVVALGVMMIHHWVGRRGYVVLLVLALGLGFVTIRRNEVYGSELSIWTDTIAKCPDGVRANYNLGNVFLNSGKMPEAIDQYEKTLRLRPDCYEAHDNLGNALCQMGRVNEAIGHYEEALRVFPDDPEAHNNFGVALWQMGQLQSAIDHFKQSVRIKPEYLEARLDLGMALAQVGSNQQAIAEFTEALRLRPDSAEAHDDLGLALFQAGNVPEAIDQFEQALRSEPDYIEAHFNLGLALEKDGRMPEAIEQYRQALGVRPDFAPAKKALIRLQVRP